MAYQQMAYIYDTLMSDAPYGEWTDFTEEVLKIHGVQSARIIDLGCGTGVITMKLAEKGYQLTGVDYSTDMLSYAEHKASDANLSIQWLHQDIRELAGVSGYDVAVSYCDVINYVTEPDELYVSFQNIADSLKPGGLFIFDIHSMYQVKEHYVDQTFADVSDDASYIWFCTGGDASGEMFHDLTFFTKQGDSYIRFDEEHHQRTYPIDFYKEILEETGFENIKVYADFSLKEGNIPDDAARIFFSASKKAGK